MAKSIIPSLQPVGRPRRFVIGVLIALGVFAAVKALRPTGPVSSLELELVDVRTRRVAGSAPHDERIVICQIEESDIAWVRRALGERWPWSLEYNAFLVKTLADAGAEALLVDVLHLDRGAGPDDLPADMKVDAQEEAQRQGEAAAAAAYRDAMQALGKTAVAMELTDHPLYDLPGRRTAAEGRWGPTSPSLVLGDGALQRAGVDLPVKGVVEGATVLGFVNATDDRDGVVRRFALTGQAGGRPVLSLPLGLATLLDGGIQREKNGYRTPTGAQAVQADSTFFVDFHDGGRRGPYARIEPAR